MFKVKMMPFFNEDTGSDIGGGAGVESASVAGEQVQSAEVQGESGVEGTEVAAQNQGIKDEKDFAAALQAELSRREEKLKKEYAEQYKDYDTYKIVGDYFQRVNNFEDVMSLKERIELDELQAQAEKQQVPVEVLQRIQQLEAKAEEGDQLKKEKELQDFYRGFRSELEAFSKEKGTDADALEQFMVDNQIGSHEIAYKAMKAEELEAKLETAKKDAIKEYLESKKAPKTEGAGAAGVISEGPPKTWGEARQRALERFRAAKQQI